MNDIGYVYFIRAGDDGLIKVGRAVNPERRMTHLQCASPVQLHLLGVVPGGIDTERMLHRQWRKYRQHGEWFTPAESILDYVAQHARPVHVQAPRIQLDVVDFDKHVADLRGRLILLEAQDAPAMEIGYATIALRATIELAHGCPNCQTLVTNSSPRCHFCQTVQPFLYRGHR